MAEVLTHKPKFVKENHCFKASNGSDCIVIG